MFNLPYVPSSEDLIDKAFRKGSEKAKAKRSTKKPREIRLRKSEEERVKAISNVIKSDLKAVVKNFPSYEQLPSFHQKLLDIKIERDRYKKSLGAVQWCLTQIERLEGRTLADIRKTRDTSHVRGFLGRSSSMVKQISNELDELVDIKMILRKFPGVEDLQTLVIAGYPNAGKSTFMRNLTGSKVEIASYPFTTQEILIGHVERNHLRIQVIDSPGLLDRTMEKRNKIELQAILALSELADGILFLLDPTQDIESQIHLLEEIEGNFKVPVTVAINKKDLADPKTLEGLRTRLKLPPGRIISAKNRDDCIQIFEGVLG
jgi:nucleolar GTP-binding protein